jgi:hypothetical protein
MVITKPNIFVVEIHNRMPVILERQDFDQWEHGKPEDAAALMKPAAEEILQRWPVSRRVNSSEAPADDPTLIDEQQAESKGAGRGAALGYCHKAEQYRLVRVAADIAAKTNFHRWPYSLQLRKPAGRVLQRKRLRDFAGPFANEVALELGQPADHGEHEPAGRSLCGESLRAIGRAYGVSHSTIHRVQPSNGTV